MTGSPTIVPFDQPPGTVARQLVRVSREQGRGRWLEQFTDALERHQARSDLDLVMHAWDLSQAEVGSLFGVSRQAVAKWRRDGVPAERAVALADLAAATEVLQRHLLAHRIPAVVRRPALALDGRSLIDVATDDPAKALRACRTMFDVSRVHG